jgi:hypothetical protein
MVKELVREDKQMLEISDERMAAAAFNICSNKGSSQS